MIMALHSRLSQQSAHCFLFGALLGFTLYKIMKEREKRNKRQSGNNCKEEFSAPRRYAAAIRLAPGQYRRYRELHDAVWSDVLTRMNASNIRNFSIFYHEETSTLYQSFEWIGHWTNPPPKNHVEEERLFEADMLSIANDPITRIWWKECEPCQEPFSQWIAGAPTPSEGGTGAWWTPLECVAHCGHWSVAYSTQQRDPYFVPLEEAKGGA